MYLFLDPSDILENNLKQILSLVWQLILRYQGNQGSQALLLSWINAVLPDKDITNFTTDWNDGLNLSALVDYCKPGLIPNHSSLDPSNATENVSNAIALAEEKLGIPKLIEPDDLTAEKPDEQSVMTYLFLFCDPTSPGQEALLSWIQKQIPSQNVTNFTTDWVNGEALGLLVNVVSASPFPANDQYKHASQEDEVENCRTSMNAAEKLLGIQPTLEAEEFANPELNPLSRATYLAHFYHTYLRPKVMDLHIPSEAGDGEMVWLDLVCPEESSDTVRGYAKGSASSHVPVEVTNLAPNKFRLKFEAKHADTYTLAVTVDEKRVKGSPFDIDLTLPDPNNVELTNTITPKKVGLPVSLFFDVSGAGRGEITAHAIGEKVGYVFVEIEQTSTFTRKVSFIPFKGDTYTLEVDFAGKQLPGSPFVFPLQSIAQPENVKCGEPEFSEPHLPVKLDIDLSNAGTGKLTANCRGETSGEIEVEFTGKQDNPNGLTFTPTAEDVYTLSIYFDDTEVNGSPFIINLHPTPPDATKVSFVEPPSRNLNVGDQIKICFDTSKAGTGTLTASCKGSKVGEIPLTVVPNYDVTFIPPEEDVYIINIMWADSHIQGSPFAINLIPKDEPDASKCEIVSPLVTTSLKSKIVSGYVSIYALNKEVSFEIDTAKAGKGSLIVTAVSQEGVGATIHIEPIPESPQVFKISYTPTTPGTHAFDLLWANEAIPGSPMSFEVIDANLVPFGILVLVNMTAKCRKRNLKANAIHQEKNTHYKMKIDKFDKSHFHLTFKPKDEGLYHLHILHQQKEFPGSPLKVQCSKAIKATSKEDGHIEFVVDPLLAGLDDGDSGGLKQSTNVSQKGDPAPTGEAPLMTQLANPSTDPAPTEEPTLASPLDGTSSPMFSPVSVTILPSLDNSPTDPASTEEWKSTSISSVESTLIPKHLPVSRPSVTLTQPVIRERSPSTDTAPKGKTPFKWGQVKEAVAGLSFEKEKFRVGKLYSFNLHCEELGMESPEFTCDPPTGAEINLSPIPGKNSHRVEIVPTKAGKHELSVLFNGKHILGSPFDVQFRPRSDASKCVLKDSPPKCKDTSTGAGNMIFCVSDKGAGKGKLTAVVMSNTTNETLPVSITRPSKHHYHVEFTPSEGLDYTLTIKYDDFNIPGSPFKLVLGDATKCRMEGEGTIEAWLNEQNRFTVNAEDAGPGQLKVKVEGEGEIVDPDVSMSADAVFEVAYQPSRCGMYSVSVKWGNLDIPGSPFQVKCRKRISASEIHITNPAAEAYIGKRIKLRLVAEGEEINQEENFTVFVRSSEGEEFPGTAERGDGGSCVCTINPPPTVGVYELHILWNGEHIPRSPFLVKYCNQILASEIHIMNPSAGAYIGTPLKLRLVAEEHEIDQEEKFTVFFHSSEDENFPGIVERGDGGSCVCTIGPPPTVGMYELHVLWSGEHIPGSPFDLEVAKQPKPSDFTVETAESESGAMVARVHGPKYAFRLGELKASVANAATTEVLPVTAAQLSQEEYKIECNPHKDGKYLLSILYNGNNIDGSPFRLIATDASLCYTKGKGLTAAQVGEENKFVVYTENAGTGELRVDMERDGEVVDVLISAASETQYEVTYNPPVLGSYEVSVQWGNQHIPGSPFDVLCVDATRYSVVEPPKETTLGKPISVGVNVADDKAPAYEMLEIFSYSKDNHTFNGEVRQDNDGNYICTILPPELRKYHIHVCCNGLDIPGSPFKTKVMPAPVPENVRAYGEGLTDGETGEDRSFTIQVSDAGHGYLGVRVHGPKKGFQVSSVDGPDKEGLISTRYTIAFDHGSAGSP